MLTERAFLFDRLKRIVDETLLCSSVSVIAALHFIHLIDMLAIASKLIALAVTDGIVKKCWASHHVIGAIPFA